MNPRDKNPAALAQRHADLAHDLAILDHLAQLAMESARQQTTHFARIAAIARCAARMDLSNDDRRMVIDTVQQLAEQFECDVRQHLNSMRSAYALRLSTETDNTALSVFYSRC
ncbi:hypothetical protein BDI4_910068 [Burkholderia diffusa]|uniref:hypothetical protein n=1 Tax=Burkholderia diffusa TaxID=488732 RepID=UPI001CAFA25A|nr:hypothetical protein [Burkholderia diffusa]CAG9265753.1 hypothetical protein BDI4_910068 [Burkholderia diffusa]